MAIYITDADPIISAGDSGRKGKEHALKFETRWGEFSASTQVIHLTTEQLLDLLRVTANRIAATLKTVE